MLKYFILTVIIMFLGGCSSASTNEEMTAFERCYDGVVYLSHRTGGDNISVKFNRDGKVATKTFDGEECK